MRQLGALKGNSCIHIILHCSCRVLWHACKRVPHAVHCCKYCQHPQSFKVGNSSSSGSYGTITHIWYAAHHYLLVTANQGDWLNHVANFTKCITCPRLENEVVCMHPGFAAVPLLPCGAASLANCASGCGPVTAALPVRSHVEADTKEGVRIKVAVHAAEGTVLGHAAGAHRARGRRRAFVVHMRLVHLPSTVHRISDSFWSQHVLGRSDHAEACTGHSLLVGSIPPAGIAAQG